MLEVGKADVSRKYGIIGLLSLESEGLAPERRRAVDIVGLTVDDDASQHALMHGYLFVRKNFAKHSGHSKLDG